MEKYLDRQEAGKVLADSLKPYHKHPNTLILALPRGGVPIGYEIAQALSLPLDVLIVRKLGVPGHEELAMGAIASGNTVIFNQFILNELKIDQADIDATVQAEQAELIRRERLYRGERPFPVLKDKTIILVDDGMATGATMQAAVSALRKHHPAAIIIAVPVAAPKICEEMAKKVDKLVCPLKPIQFDAVGFWYAGFEQVSDEEVIFLLSEIK